MQSSTRKIHITVSGQQLELQDGEGRVLKSFPVSTSLYGIGSEPGSFKTPAGRFSISEKIGDGAIPGAVFKSRVPTGEIGSEENPDDLVQTRILRLNGLDAGNANTFERYIYIHGTNHESSIGLPVSHGCIRMRNDDVIELFEAVEVNTEVQIEP